MSKLSFRARQLDASKPMPVYRIEEIPDLPDFAAINRAVPQMPTGMEKEEETEHHLQRALSAQQVYGTSEALVIPVPEINNVDERYRNLYAPEAPYKPPRQYIHVQPFGMEQEIPDYDMDSEDETWMSKQSKKLEVTPFKFETMMDRLEKGSGQTVMTLQEAKALLKEDDDLIIAVYDYWLNKRLTLQHALIPSVKTEKRDGSTSNNPYVAFRRRTEKMQTRKNRKNDEVSYEKMLKLRRDLKKALTILELMKRREKSKKELLKLTIEIVDKRYQMQDFDGSAYKDANAKRHTLPNTFIQSYTEYINARKWADREEQTYAKKAKRRYNKRKDREKVSASSSNTPSQPPTAASVHLPQYTEIDIMQTEPYSDEEENSPHLSPVSEHETEPDDPDGPFAFKRKPGCFYHAPISVAGGGWPLYGREPGGFGDARYRYSLAALSQPKRCVGFVRRRYGRGGRVLLDRGFTDWDDQLEELEFSSPSSPHEQSSASKEYFQYIKDHKIPFFRPQSPVEEEPLAASVLDDSLSPLPVEFSMETYESHREQLLQMQRDQQECLLKQEVADVIGDLGCSYPPPVTTSHTLDSEKAQFAVSAVCAPSEAATLVTQEGRPVAAMALESANTTASRASPIVLQNGGFQEKCVGSRASPAVLSSPSVFSTSPAANVLQLNYPLPSDHASLVTQASAAQPPGPTTNSHISLALPISLATKRGTQLLKIGQTAQQDTLTKEKHEGANNLLADKVVAMEVT